MLTLKYDWNNTSGCWVFHPENLRIRRPYHGFPYLSCYTVTVCSWKQKSQNDKVQGKIQINSEKTNYRQTNS